MLDIDFNSIIPEKGKKWLVEQPSWPIWGRSLLWWSKHDQLGFHASDDHPKILAIPSWCTSPVIKNINCKIIYICTDSEAAIKALLSPRVNSKIVKEWKVELSYLSGSNDFGYVDKKEERNIENEEGDEVAGCGSSHIFVGPVPCLGITKTYREGNYLKLSTN